MQEVAYRVLDICCGDGYVRGHLVEKMPGAQIHYFGIDHLARLSFEKFGEELAERGANIASVFVPQAIEFHNTEIAARQIERVAEGAKFHEIHFHMPYMHDVPHNEESQISLLFAMSLFLKEGGKIYHAFQYSPFAGKWFGSTSRSALLRQMMDGGAYFLNVDEGEIASEHKENCRELGRRAHLAGITLAKYGLHIRKAEWTADGKIGGRASEKIARAVRMRTKYPEYAAHYAVFKKC